MKSLLFLLLLALIINVQAQVAINTDGSSPDNSALLDVKSSTKGMLIPRTSSTSRLAIVNPAKGLILYDTTTSSFWFYNATFWKEITTGSNGWNLTGNAGTNANTSFIGTTDANDLVFRTNNIQRVRLKQNGSIHLVSVNLNTIIGDSAGVINTGTANHFIGYHAGKKNTTGYYNYFSGYEAGGSNTTGSTNHFEGLAAGYSNTTGNNNFFSGVNAGYSNTTGSDNYFSGYNSLVRIHSDEIDPIRQIVQRQIDRLT